MLALCLPILNNAAYGNSHNSNIKNGTYSSRPTCNNSYSVIDNPWEIEKGIINNNAQNKEIFPKLWCQKCSATKGKTAIDNKIPTKGRTQKISKFCPLRWGAPSAPAKIILGKMNRNNKSIL